MFDSWLFSNHKNDNWALSAGVVAGLLMTFALALGRFFEVTPLNLEMGLGATVTRTIGPVTWILGLFFHLILSAAFGLLYAKGFKLIGRIGLAPGLTFGLIHWAVVGILLGILPIAHQVIEYYPQAPSHSFGAPQLLRPGFFGFDLGTGTVLSIFLIHLIFGSIVGMIGLKAKNKSAHPQTRKEAPLVKRKPHPI